MKAWPQVVHSMLLRCVRTGAGGLRGGALAAHVQLPRLMSTLPAARAAAASADAPNNTPLWHAFCGLGALGLVGTAGAATVLCEAESTDSAPEGPKKEPVFSLMHRCAAEAVGAGIIVTGGCGVVCAGK